MPAVASGRGEVVMKEITGAVLTVIVSITEPTLAVLEVLVAFTLRTIGSVVVGVPVTASVVAVEVLVKPSGTPVTLKVKVSVAFASCAVKVWLKGTPIWATSGDEVAIVTGGAAFTVKAYSCAAIVEVFTLLATWTVKSYGLAVSGVPERVCELASKFMPEGRVPVAMLHVNGPGSVEETVKVTGV